MDEPNDADDEGLKQRQGTALYPLGRALRSTYDADNHATLSAETTALMLDLARIPYEPCAKEAPTPPAQPEAQSLIARMRTLLTR